MKESDLPLNPWVWVMRQQGEGPQAISEIAHVEELAIAYLFLLAI